MSLFLAKLGLLTCCFINFFLNILRIACAMGNSNFFSVLQKVGRSFMLPIALLPVAGLFLGIGASFTNPTTISSSGLEGLFGTVLNGEVVDPTVLFHFFTVMAGAGDIVFANLPLLFALGVAIGLANQEKATSALASVVFFIIMHKVLGSIVEAAGNKVDAADMVANGQTEVLGIFSLEMGVFGGVIAGVITATLHNRFYKIQLPSFLAFFEGTRFVPIISALFAAITGAVLFFIWPFVQTGIENLGSLVLNSGYFGTFLYGVIERSLIPFGLHHVFYVPFWQTAVGGTQLALDGTLVSGAQNIFFGQLGGTIALNESGMFSIEYARFMAGKFPFMIFGLPAAAFAMYRHAFPGKKKIVKGLLVSAAFTAMLTGITEPIEFSFLFVAPVLYIVHAFLAGLSFMFMHIFNIPIGQTFSGGFIDFTLFGILQGQGKTNWLFLIPLGIAYAVVYYFVFSILIKKLNLKTPGREDESEETKLFSKKDYQDKVNAGKISADQKYLDIIAGLGGVDNIVDLDNCATRLRVEVKDSALVDKDLLKTTGALGTLLSGSGVQVIYGPTVSNIKSNVSEVMEKMLNSSK